MIIKCDISLGLGDPKYWILNKKAEPRSMVTNKALKVIRAFILEIRAFAAITGTT